MSNLLTESEAAAILAVAPGTLSVWRSRKKPFVPYVKIGRSVRYRLSDLEAFVAGNARLGVEASPRPKPRRRTRV